MQTLISENMSLWCSVLSRPRLSEGLGRSRAKEGGPRSNKPWEKLNRDNKAAELSRPRFTKGMSRFRLKELQGGGIESSTTQRISRQRLKMKKGKANCMTMSHPRLIRRQRGVPVIESHKAGTGYDLDESFGVDSVEGICRK